MVAAFFTAGAASSSFLLARYMSRRGRRPGLRLGYLIGLVGAVIAFIGIEVDVLLVFLIGSMLFGAAQASTLQARFAAADLAEPHQRSLYISTLVWTGAIGSVTGPLLVGRAKSLGVDRGFEELAGPYGVSVVLLALAAVAVTVLLRPDPLVVSGGIGGASAKFPPLTESVRLIWSGPATRLALIAMTVSQAVMVAVMTMTPSHMKEHGHDVDLVGQIFSIHVAGMFLFSPAGRMGHRPHGTSPSDHAGQCHPDRRHRADRPRLRPDRVPRPRPLPAGPGLELRTDRRQCPADRVGRRHQSRSACRDRPTC